MGTHNICHIHVADILDRVSPKFHQLGIGYECLGGGRINHDSAGKKIKIYGYSVVSDTGGVLVTVLVFVELISTLQQLHV